MPADSESAADSKRHEEAVARFRGYLAMAAEVEVAVLATDETPAGVNGDASGPPDGMVAHTAGVLDSRW